LKKTKKRDIVKIIGIIAFIIVGIVTYLYSEGIIGTAPPVNDNTYVDFINCGQGDSTLIVSEGNATLIDASTKENEQDVVEHLKSRGIKKIDHFVLTHSHEDHIGGAAAILDTFEVDTVYMAKPTSGTQPTTKVYINLLKSIKEKGIACVFVSPEDQFVCGKFQFHVLGPIDQYEDSNDQSIVLRAVYNKVSFLFKGDQESGAEKDLVERYGNKLKSTVYAVSHHGSSSSSSKTLLDVVRPKYAVISCGEGNSYGHPHKETINRLEKYGIEFYRTDQEGTVTFITDGNSIQYGG
jgi:competence protein ComEC